jgi:hypothetical protein
VPDITAKLSANMQGRTMNVSPAEMDAPSVHLQHVLGANAPTWRQLLDAGVLETTTPGAPARPGDVGLKINASIEDYRPAILTMPDAANPRGRLIPGEKGDSHNDIIARHNLKTEDIDRRTFAGPNGEEVDRQTMARLLAERGQPSETKPATPEAPADGRFLNTLEVAREEMAKKGAPGAPQAPVVAESATPEPAKPSPGTSTNLPRLATAIRSRDTIRMEFDLATGRPPTAEEIEKLFRDAGFNAYVTAFAPNEWSIAQGRADYRVDVADERHRMSSEHAKAAYEKIFGTTEDIRGQTAIQMAIPFAERLERSIRAAREREGTQPKGPKAANAEANPLPEAEAIAPEPAPPSTSIQATHSPKREEVLGQLAGMFSGLRKEQAEAMLDNPNSENAVRIILQQHFNLNDWRNLAQEYGGSPEESYDAALVKGVDLLNQAKRALGIATEPTPDAKPSGEGEKPTPVEPPMPDFRDWRFRPSAVNAGTILPNRPGAKFTQEQFDSIIAWAKSIGLRASGTLNIIRVGNNTGEPLDLSKYGAYGVRQELLAKERSEKQQGQLPGVQPADGLTEDESARLADLTAKIEANTQLTATERKRYQELRDKATGAQRQAPGGVEAGPRELSPGEPGAKSAPGPTVKLDTLDAIRAAVKDPKSGLSDEHRDLLGRMDKAGLLENYPGLRMEVASYIAGGAQGEYRDGFARFLHSAASDAPLHEFLHHVWRFMSDADRAYVARERKSALMKVLNQVPDEHSGRMLSGTTSDAFLAANLDRGLYHLANDSEFFAWLMGRKGVEEWNKPEATTFVGKVRDFIKSLWHAVKDSLGLSAREDALWRKIVSGKAAYRNAEALRFKPEGERRLSLATSPEKLREQRELEPQIVPSLRAVAAYGDLARTKDRIAQELDLSEGARKLIGLPRAAEMYALGASDPAVAGIEDYAQARAAVANANPTIRWNVTKDALHSLGNDERRSIARKQQREAMMRRVQSPGFQRLMTRWTRARFAADLTEQKERSFRNTLLVQITDLNNQINAANVDDARTDALRESLRQLRGMMTQTRAVSLAMDDIVSRAYPEMTANARGGYWDPQRMDPTGMYAVSHQTAEDFFQLYQRARAAEGNPITNANEITIAQLASKILSANFELANRLVVAEIWKRDPDFASTIEGMGRAFTQRLVQDPATAIRELVAKGAKLATKADQARQALLALDKTVTKTLRQANDLDQAVMADERMKASPDWQALVSQVNADAQAVHVPDNVRDSEVNKTGEVFDEFHATMNALDPSGAMHKIDVGFTPESVAAAQPRIQAYLQAVGEWLFDPAHENHPDKQYWQLQYDWHDALYNSLSVLDPSSQQSLIGFHLWSMPEFFFRQASLPQTKILQKAFENWHRAVVQSNQWNQGTIAPLMRTLRRAVVNQNAHLDPGAPRFETTGSFEDYRARVLNHLAWAYRHGIAVQPGERLHGVTIHAEDIDALRAMGGAVQKLVKTQKNIGAERIMQHGWLIDEWLPGTFAIRQPQEFGAEAGTTVPRDPSRRAARLCQAVDALPTAPEARAQTRDSLQAMLDSQTYFEPFVMSWLGERSSDYSKATPFETLFRDLYRQYNEGGPDAPRSLDDVFDYLEANSGGDYDRDTIRNSILDRMEAEIRSFQKRFFTREETKGNAASDIRVERATRDGPFTKGFERDSGSSFFYDYGMISAQEVFSMGIDASMYHTVRLAKALESTELYLSELLKPMPGKDEHGRKEFLARQKDLFKRGQDFRDFETLQQQLAFVQMMRRRLPIWGGKNAAQYEGLQNLYRVIGDEVSMKLGGLTTLARVFTGSIFKQGFVLSGMERGWVTSVPKAMLSMAMSFARIGIGGPLAMAARRVGLMKRFEGELSGWAEEMFRFGHFFNEQYRFGLGVKTPTLDTVWNNLTMPYTHGRGYDPKFSDLWMLRLPQKAYYRALSVLETPIEGLKAMLPALGYAVAYDSVARQVYWGLKGLEIQARGAFDYHEKHGSLAQFDLDNPSNVVNKLSPSELLPRGILPKTATHLAQVREMWNRGTDTDFQEAVIKYWRKLRDTPVEQRDAVSFLAPDAASPEEAKRIEAARAGALASIGLFDIHHASPANRPWAMRESPSARLLMPIAGWFLQSTRQIPALLGKAPYDRKYSTAMMTALTVAGIVAFAAWSDLTGDVEKRLFDKLKWIAHHQIDPVKHMGMGRNVAEEVKIHVSNITGYITILNSMVNALLGEQSNRGVYGAQVFVSEMINSALNYVSGVAHTHDITYGLPAFLANQAPITKIVTSRLPSQDGLTNERNARTIIQRYAPQELLRQSTGGYGMTTPTELSPIKQRLANAIYRGDSIGVAEAYQDFLDTARKLGRTDPEKLAASVIRSLNPYSLALVGHLTEAQRAEILAKLKPQEQQVLMDAETNFLAGSQMLGIGSEMVRKEPGDGDGSVTGGQVLPSARVNVLQRTIAGRPPGGLGARPRFGVPRLGGLRFGRASRPKLRIAPSHFRGSHGFGLGLPRLKRRKRTIYA